MGVKLLPNSVAPVTELIHAGTVSCVQIHRQIRYYQKSKTFHGANTIHPHPCYRESNLEIRGYLQGGGVDRGSKKEVVPQVTNGAALRTSHRNLCFPIQFPPQVL